MSIPEFVVSLREKIGHSPLWLSGSTAVIFDEDRILLVRRAEDGEWSPVTGVIDPGEHPADTAVREAMEEAGVTIEAERLAAIGVTDPITYGNGDRTQYIDHTFRCRYLEGEARADGEETTDARWFPIDEMPPMPPHFEDRIRAARAESGPAEFGGGRPVRSGPGQALPHAE
jgi:8-oxo-dGTP pyrophosphatase MutT (NUDIX family)